MTWTTPNSIATVRNAATTLRKNASTAAHGSVATLMAGSAGPAQRCKKTSTNSAVWATPDGMVSGLKQDNKD